MCIRDILTTITTMLGLIPLALSYSIDPIARTIDYDSNVSGFWAPLGHCIVYGLSFSAFLTLIVTPCMIVLPSRLKNIFKRSKGQEITAKLMLRNILSSICCLKRFYLLSGLTAARGIIFY